MTRPTMADHHRDAVHFPACSCGAVWRQRGNLTGHCTRCHETFQGVSLFDRHQHTGPDGRTICTPPADLTVGRAETPLECRDGVWRGPRMSPETIAARFGAASPGAERPSKREITAEQGTGARIPAPAVPDAAERRTAPQPIRED